MEEVTALQLETTPNAGIDLHTNLSSYREMLLEHLFSGAVMRHLWLQHSQRMELLKPQVDDGGYDLVLEVRGIVRHVQLKASHANSSTARQPINIALAEKPTGCVVWIRFDEQTLDLGPFLWFGSAPGSPLPTLDGYPVAVHAKANAQGVKTARPRIRSVPRSAFSSVADIEGIVSRLFGL